MTGPIPEDPPEPTSTDAAFISADDVERAKLRFREVAPSEYRDLLEAGEDPGT